MALQTRHILQESRSAARHATRLRLDIDERHACAARERSTQHEHGNFHFD